MQSFSIPNQKNQNSNQKADQRIDKRRLKVVLGVSPAQN